MAKGQRETLITAFEEQIGRPLPDDYRRFLLAGAVPACADAPANPYTEILHSLYDLGGADTDSNLGANYAARPRELPAWFLPIGEAFGVILGIWLSGVQQGKVFQWDSDHEEVAEVAGSFDGFPIRVRCRAAEWEASQGGQ